ncbi:T9SS-dependent M6-like inactivated metalloprotease [Caldithrix abyssi]
MKMKMNILVAGFVPVLLALNLSLAQTPSSFDSLKICALRVEFQPDENPLTTGNGLFMIDTVTTDPFAVDPAPHNKQYFEDQLAAAANYFWKVSKGRLTITGDVFPSGENEAFRLPRQMGAYNPNTTDEEINKGISQLFVDAVKAADQSAESIDFSQYDLVVIFHAGVGRDIELGYDPTPQDIPSLYLSPAFLKAALGDTFNGVPVNNGQKLISSGILLPETQNQEGYHIALTGFLVSNIGSYLGLYDLFSPSTQKSAVGRFGLMDAGLLNVNGLIPAPPSAFSRYLLGWENPVELSEPAADIPLARLFSESALTGNTLYKVPINQDEYYLIECRGDPAVNIDSLYQELAYARDELPSYMELLKTYLNDGIEIGPSGVLTGVENYDWGLPGSGILIWHIDERVIREKGAQNRINDDPNWRAVDLEEADGSQDIGQNYTLLDAGYGTELGWFADFWFKNRPDYLKNFELYQNEFSSTSRPATVSNWNHALSHIKLYNFSENRGDVMFFSFTREMTEKGFPLSLTATAEQAATDFLWLKYRNDNYLYFGLDNGQVKVLTVDDSLQQTEIFAVYDDQDGAPLRYLNAMEISGDEAFDNLVMTYEQKIVIKAVEDARQSALNPALEWQAPASIVARPVVDGNQLLVNCANDSLYRLEVNGSSLSVVGRQAGYGNYRSLVFYPEFALPEGLTVDYIGVGVHADQTRFLAMATREDQQTVFTIIEGGKKRFFTIDALPVADFSLADMDGNGRVDIVFNSENKIFALNTNGTFVTDFPIEVAFDHADRLIGTPLIADLDGDGEAEIVVASQNGGLLAFSRQGKLLVDFPLSIGGQMSGSPALVQWDEDAPLELLAVNDQGLVTVWELNYNGTPETIWPLARLNPTGNPVFQLQGGSVVQEDVSLLPAGRAYNYPNPNEGNFTTIRYYLSEPAQVFIRIFDLAGKRVLTIDMPGRGQTDNEFVWNVEDVPSGVYLCQIEAKSDVSGKTERRLFKIMVVH